MPLTAPTIPALLAGILLLSACGFGGGGRPALPDGKEIETTADFETYETNDQKNRVRFMKELQAGDAAALDVIDSVYDNPADYRNLITLTDQAYRNTMAIEVVAKLDGPGGEAERLVRLTVDQAKFENEKDGALVDATGEYSFRGESYAWVTIDDGPLLSGHHAQGLEYLNLNLEKGMMTIEVRTEISATSQVEISLKAEKVPFNIRTGAYGGDITISVRDPSVDQTYIVDGSLRGNVGGTPGYTNDSHGLTTSGIFTGSGENEGKTITVDGIYFGKDLPRANAN